MRLVIPALIASATLLGCGGGDGQTNAPHLSENIVTVQAGVYHPAGGFVFDPGNPGNCPDLYAYGEFTADPGPFPADVAMPLIEIYQDGALLWSGPVRSDFGLLSNGNLHAVAAACGIKSLPAEGTPLAVRFVLTGAGATTSVVTPPLPLLFVY
jgi:hypothetical protein